MAAQHTEPNALSYGQKDFSEWTVIDVTDRQPFEDDRKTHRYLHGMRHPCSAA